MASGDILATIGAKRSSNITLVGFFWIILLFVSMVIYFVSFRVDGPVFNGGAQGLAWAGLSCMKILPPSTCFR